MLIELEAAHDSIGWDNLPPTVYIVARDRDELVVCPVPLDHGHPRPLLVALAVGASKPENWPDLQHLYPAPPLAHILIMETWSRWAPMDNGEEAAFRAGRALADIPGSIEGRYGIAMLGDCDIHLARDRGEAPRILSNDYTGPTTASDRFDGVMYRALRQLHTATVNQYLAHHFAHHFARTGDTS